MKELSPAEYRTALAVLALPGATERERILSSGLPSSTYNLARKRIYQEGWIEDRFVPNPGATGFGAVEVVLRRVTFSDRESWEKRYASDPSCALLWSGVHALLGVFFRPEAGEAPRAEGRDGVSPATLSVRVSRTGGECPVYLDFSGCWSRFGRYRPPGAYPGGLDPRAPTEAPRVLAACQSALVRHGELSPSPAEEGGASWINVLRLPRSQRRAVERGALLPRTLLHPAQVPAFQGRRMGEVILLGGRKRSGTATGALLNALTRSCGVFPFLYAEDDRSVLLAGMGLTSSERPGRVTLPSAQRPVMRTLQEHLEDIEVVLEAVEALRELVAYRHTALVALP